MKLLNLNDFPTQTHDKLRFGDTDAQGHVNNAVFSTFFETGRTELLEMGRFDGAPDLSFVIARLCVDYRKEVFWPGTVEIGSGVIAIGRSSITCTQSLFQNGICVATAESVVVQVDAASHRATPLSEETKARLATLMVTIA